MDRTRTIDSTTPHDVLMYEAYGVDAGLSPAQHDVVYGFAWGKGHPNGEHEVEVEYREAAEFAVNLLNVPA